MIKQGSRKGLLTSETICINYIQHPRLRYIGLSLLSVRHTSSIRLLSLQSVTCNESCYDEPPGALCKWISDNDDQNMKYH